MDLPYWNEFANLVRIPFQHLPLVWGIVPLYVGLLVSEMMPAKADSSTALQTGFSFLWAGAQWLYPYFRAGGSGPARLEASKIVPVNLFVTCLVILLGILALVCGFRRRFPKYASFIGHTRFANYFMIAIFPIQAHYLAWTWPRVAAILLYALPVWIVLHFGLMPLRRRK